MPYLRIKTGADRGKLYEITDKPLTIGRDRDQSIQLLDQGVSRQHVTVFKIGELYIVRDEGATNGTYVNSVKVQEEVLKSGDEILVGATLLVFEDRVTTARIDRSSEKSDAESLGTTTIEIVVEKDKESKQPGREIESKSLSSFFEIGKILNVETDPEAIFNKTTAYVARVIKSDHAYLLSVDEQTHKFRPLVSAPDGKDIKVSKAIIQHVMQSKRPLLTTDAAMDQRFTYSESVILRRIKSVICAPLMTSCDFFGLWYFHSTGERGTFTAEDLELVFGCALQVAISASNLKKCASAKDVTLETVRSLVTATETYNSQIQGHSGRVAAYSQAIAKVLSLSADEIYNIKLSALLHDIGKVSVCMDQNGKSDAESLKDERHIFAGQKVVSAIKGLEHLLPGVKYHCERADGSGYPFKILNKDTPMMARIIIVANAFDNLMLETKSASESKDLLKDFAMKEKEFDPDCLKAALICHRNGTLYQQSTTL